MPQVPMYESPQVKQQGLSNAKIQNNSTLESFGGGKAATGFDAIAKTLDTAQSVGLDLKEKADQRSVMDAVNEFQNHDNELTAGENGFLKVKGKPALGITDQYQELAKKKSDEILNSLGNDQQKYLFKQNADKIMSNLKMKTEMHSNEEYGKYQDLSDQGGVSTNVNTAMLNHGNESIVQDSINKKNAHIMAMADRHGWDQDMINSKISETNSKIRLGNTMTIMQGQTASRADAYLKTHQGDFTAEDLLHANKVLESGLRDEKATYLADQIFGKENYTDVSSANERAKQIGDEKLRDETMSKIKIHIAMRDNQIKEDHTKTIVDSSNFIEKGGSVSKLPPDVQGRFTPKEREALALRELQVAGAAPLKTDITKYSKYDSMEQLELGKKTLADLMIDARPNLNNDQWNRIRNKWEVANAAIGGDKKAKDTWAGYQNEDETLMRSMKDAKIAGLDPDTLKEKMNEDQKKAYHSLQNDLNDRSLLWSASNGGKKPDGDTMRKLANNLVGEKAMKIYTEGTFLPSYFDSEKQVGQLSASEKEKAYVKYDKIPKQEVSRMLRFMISNNKIKGLDESEALSLINSNSGMGEELRSRMQKAYGQIAVGNKDLYLNKLLGK